MYELRDIGGHIICRIDSNEYDRKVVLRDNIGREIGYGKEETHALRVSTIYLYLDDQTYIGKLERELGMGGSPDCVLFSGQAGNRHIPVDEFGNPYIIRVLFGYDAQSHNSEKKTFEPGDRRISRDIIPVFGEIDDDGGYKRSRLDIDDEIIHKTMLIASLIGIVASAFFAKTAMKYESLIIQIATLAIPGFFGTILFLICLFHRHGGLTVRIAGLIESICTSVVMSVVLRVSILDEKNPVEQLYYQAEKLLPKGSSFLNGLLGVVLGLACVFLFFFLLYLFFVLLAVAYRLCTGIVKTEEQKEWIRSMNHGYHTIIFSICVVLTLCAIVLFVDETVFTSILLGLFCGLFSAAAFLLCLRISDDIL